MRWISSSVRPAALAVSALKSDSAAIFERNPEGSKKVICRVAVLPEVIRSQNCSRLVPPGATTPIPVTTVLLMPAPRLSIRSGEPPRGHPVPARALGREVNGVAQVGDGGRAKSRPARSPVRRLPRARHSPGQVAPAGLLVLLGVHVPQVGSGRQR